MKMKKKLLNAVLALTTVFSCLFFANVSVSAATNAIVIINNAQLSTAAPSLVIDGKPFVYFETLAAALGANMDASIWETTTKRMTISFGNRLLILQEGSPTISIATIGNGQVLYIQNFDMLALPLMVDDYALVPLEPIVVALGAQYSWNPDTNTALIYMDPPATPTPQPTPVPATPEPVYIPPVVLTPEPVYVTPVPVIVTPSPTPYARNPVFADTTHYQEISGKRAQDMWDFNNKFALVLFSSADPTSVALMPGIKESAAAVGYKIHGVDVSSGEFVGLSSLTWVYNYVDRNAPSYPRMFLKYENETTAHEIKDLTNKNNIVSALTALSKNVKPTAVPTATPVPTPTPFYNAGNIPYGATAYTGYSTTFTITRNMAQQKCENNEKFFYVYYNTSSDSNTVNIINTIADTAQKMGITVFITNFSFEDGSNWFGNYGASGGGYMYNPTIYAVQNGSYANLTVSTDVQSITDFFNRYR